MKIIEQQFKSLCKSAMDAYDETLDGITYESTLVNILEFVKVHKNEKPLLVNQFKEIMHTKDAPLEAVSFCMRELQWPEIYEYACEEMNKSTDPRVEAYRPITEAYSDHWPDEDLYEYYSK